MDLVLQGRCHSFVRNFECRENNMIVGYTPLVTRRPSTSYNVRKSFSPSPRIQSAQSRLGMAASPKSHVSTAGFYDWSSEEATGDVSVTNIYRKISITQKNKFNKGNKHWCTDGIHLNPGRMFVRDKAELTKGEREIIAGICKNRGDVARDSRAAGVVTHVKSHKDAWLIGKQVFNTHNNRLTDIDPDRCSIRVPETLFSKLEPSKNSSTSPCYLCDKCKDDCKHDQIVKDTKVFRTDRSSGRSAPPSSPTQLPKVSKSNGKTHHLKASVADGAVFIEAGKTFIDPEMGSKKKKVFVDVFLPKFPASSMQDDKTCISLDLGTSERAADNTSFSNDDDKSNKQTCQEMVESDKDNTSSRSSRSINSPTSMS